MATVENIFTVDLEEWFVVEILKGRYSPDDWPGLQSSVVKNTLNLLDVLNRYKVRATWFVLGWCVDKYPDLIQEVFRHGHEIACHSFYHRRVDLLSKDEFRRDTEMAINAIVKAIGNGPFGYRAPSWSINATNSWSFEVLADMGFVYDSSIFPIKHDLYGWPDGPRHPFKMEFKGGRSLYELPATTYRVLGRNIPVGGGGYFRHSPYWYSRKVIKNLNNRGLPVIFYVHPWEMDKELPFLEGLSTVQRFRTYGSVSLLRHKMEKLLTDFSFTTMADYLRIFKRKRIGFE